jgi:hypothetical protein
MLRRQFNPGFSSFELSFSQDATSTRLNIVRPIAHPTWPINTTGPTNVVFATGNGNVLAYHSANRGVRVYTCCTSLGPPNAPCMCLMDRVDQQRWC